MKTCAKCGTQCNDNFLFCKQCGQKFETDAAPSPAGPAAGAPVYPPPAQEAPAYNPAASFDTPSPVYAYNPSAAEETPSAAPPFSAAPSPAADPAAGLASVEIAASPTPPDRPPEEDSPAQTAPAPEPPVPDFSREAASSGYPAATDVPEPVIPVPSWDAPAPMETAPAPAVNTYQPAEPPAPYAPPAAPDAPTYSPPPFQPQVPAYSFNAAEGHTPPAAPAYPVAAPAAVPAGPTIDTARRLMGSPLVLVVFITHAVQLLLALYRLYVGAGLSPFARIIEVIFEETSNQRFTSSFWSTLDAMSLVSGIAGMLPVAALGLGWLFVYMAAKKGQGPPATTGFTILRIVWLIGLIGSCLVFGSAFFGYFIGLLTAGAFAELPSDPVVRNAAVTTLAAGAAVIVALGAAVISFFLVGVRALGSAVQSIRTAQPYRRFFEAAGVFFLVAGVLCVAGSFVNFAYLNVSQALLATMLSSVVGAAQCILIGVLSLKAARQL